jgi:hypothetical protein
VTTSKTQLGKSNRALLATLFSRVLYKTQFSNQKNNQNLLGIDLLKDDKRKALLSITTVQVEKLYTQLLENPESRALMHSRGQTLLLYSIIKSCDEFLAKEYGYKVKVNRRQVKLSLYTKFLLKNAEILFRVPYYSILDPSNPNFNSIYSPVYKTPSPILLEAFLDNLVIEISNCVIFFIITTFSESYTLRQTLFRSKFLSWRNFERFQNNLRWQLNIKTYITYPMDLYNSSFDLYLLGSSGIYSRTIFANRASELSNLKQLSLITVLSLEARDFFVSRIEELIYLLSTSLRFTVSSVFGQFLGLLWRGIIEGLKK